MHSQNRRLPQVNELSIERIDGLRLAHAYVALALARNVAQQYVAEQPPNEGLRSLLTTLDVTADLLEELMKRLFQNELPPPSSPVLSSSIIM